MVPCDPLELTRLGYCVGRTLVRLQAGHFGPDVRTRCQVVMEEWLREPVVGKLLVAEEEPGSCFRVPQPLEIHGQEGDVGADVHVAQLIRELDAIENPNPVTEAEDVIGLKIPVSITYPTTCDTSSQQPLSTVHPAKGPPPDLDLVAVVEDRAHEAIGFDEVGLPIFPQRLDGRGVRDLWRAGRAPMERDQGCLLYTSPSPRY